MTVRISQVFRLLVAVWLVVVAWQGWEHYRIRDQAKTAVVHRARDITGTLGVVIRSQRRFGIVSKPRLESALNELVQSDELKSVLLFNATGDVVASAGDPFDLGAGGVPQSGVRWNPHAVTVVNLVDLGTNVPPDGSTAPPTLVLPEPNREDARRETRPRFAPPGPRPREEAGTNAPLSGSNAPSALGPPGGFSEDARRENRPRFPPPGSWPRENLGTNDSNPDPSRTNHAGPPSDSRRFGGNRWDFRRPPWMNEAEYNTLTAQKGLHGLAIVLSNSAYRAACARDLWLRGIITGFAAVAAVGFGLAWRNLVRYSDLQMRLVRASELNTHLREMNVAAAGLAHETRNPLNIIRGLAQLISKAPETSEVVRKKALEITDEVDRVTVQLNEFINYSKPREVRRAPVVIGPVINEVVRALKSDCEDKAVQLEIEEENLTINADQPLLRQVLFNLLLNAIQAVPERGRIQIAGRKSGSQEAWLEVRDNGPGVPADHRQEIFRPYFTTRPHGTGLGLAVVKQIVLAHGWEVECLPNLPAGALFRVSRLELIAANGS